MDRDGGTDASVCHPLQQGLDTEHSRDFSLIVLCKLRA